MNYISKIISIQLKSKLQPAIIALLFIPVFSIAQSSKNILTDWAFGGFVCSENNPIISPDSTVLFNDPISDKPNAWESDNTFNPGAAIKDGKVMRYSPDSYCAGQVLFDSKDPSKPIARLDVPFLRPMEPFEKSGQYVNGTVFIEGMAFFKKKWYLYYGCADSRIGVAIYDPSVHAPPDPIILNKTP